MAATTTKCQQRPCTTAIVSHAGADGCKDMAARLPGHARARFPGRPLGPDLRDHHQRRRAIRGQIAVKRKRERSSSFFTRSKRDSIQFDLKSPSSQISFTRITSCPCNPSDRRTRVCSCGGSPGCAAPRTSSFSAYWVPAIARGRGLGRKDVPCCVLGGTLAGHELIDDAPLRACLERHGGRSWTTVGTVPDGR